MKPAAERKDYCVKTYFNRTEYLKLQRISLREGMSLSAIVHELAATGKYVARFTPEQNMCIIKIATMADQLDRLSRLADAGCQYGVNEKLAELADKLNDIIIKVSKW